MRYTEEELINKVKKLIEDNKITKITQLMELGISHFLFYKKHKLHKNNEIADLLTKNNTLSKRQYINDNVDKALLIKNQAIEFLDKHEIRGGNKPYKHWTHHIITTLEALCVDLLGIHLKEYFRLGLRNEEEITYRLTRNRQYNLKISKAKILSNPDTQAAIIGMKIYGDDELRQKLSTSYQQVKSENKNEISGDIKINKLTDEELATRIKELKDKLKA